MKSTVKPAKKSATQQSAHRDVPGLGVATALALTPSGGVVTRVECLLLSGRGKLILTGNLVGEAKDSGQVALSLARRHAHLLGVHPSEFLRTDVHFHVPEGLPSKGGPSLGLAMFVALIAAVTGKTVSPENAFTGELSLSGKLHPVGGIQEKIAAAQRANILYVYAPHENVSESGSNTASSPTLVAVDHIDTLFARIFKTAQTRSSRPRIA